MSRLFEHDRMVDTVVSKKRPTVTIAQENDLQNLSYLNSIEKLKTMLRTNPEWEIMLCTSLIEAKQNAIDSGLKNMDLFAWPIDLRESNGYYQYLTDFSRWVPTEARSYSRPDYDEEIMFKLCHFYWLIDQKTGLELQATQDFEGNYPFADWLVEFANDWGSFLNTTESITTDSMQSFMDQPLFGMNQYMIPEGNYTPSGNGATPNNPSKWLTFNQFFAREVLPGLRPITEMDNQTVVVAPADAEYKKVYAINSQSQIVMEDGVASDKTHRIKGSHAYSINELVGEEYGDRFANGKFVHSFLSPYDMHRFCAPVKGKVLESKAIQGRVFLEVVITDGKFDAPDNAENGYEFKQTRGVLILEMENKELVAVIPIGMAQVSSVNMNASKGVNLYKGQEFGYFLFGGSDIIMLFQEDSQFKLNLGSEPKKQAGQQFGTIQY